jgi:MSHA biogenesis protein MshK
MAKPLNQGLWHAIGLLAIAASGSAAAENLPDPTMPSTGGYVAQSRATVASGPTLQSVMISPSRRVAVISGQAVKLGEKYGDSQVVKITESEVVLQNESGSQTLRLYPGVEKKLTSRTEPRNETRRH